jgi:hypothetical protein
MPRRCSVLGFAAALAALSVVAGSALAAWPPDGVPLCSECRARYPLMVSDEAGGAFVVWADARNSTDGTNNDIYLQHVTASGDISTGWPANGLPVTTAPQSQLMGDVHSLTPDGSGGVIIAWVDLRNTLTGTTGADIYAQRVLANASIAPGWSVNGVPVTRAPADQSLPVVLADGSGGAFVSWDDEGAPEPNIYLQHLTSDGTLASGWPPDGLPICTASGIQGGPQLTPDGVGGLFVAWGDLRDGPPAVYAQRVTPPGLPAPGWPTNGVRIVLGRYIREILSDGAGGAYLSCATAGSIIDGAYFLQRFAGEGSIASGWPAGGMSACQAPDEREGIRMVGDGTGGVVLAWGDYRDNHDEEIFALRMRPDGTRSPSWPLNGVRLTNYLGFDSFPDLCPDAASGAYMCWERQSGPFTADRQVLVQHLTASGTVAAGWPANGFAVQTNVASGRPHIVEDGAGGAIVAWEDVTEHVRALRFNVDGPVPVAVASVSAEAEPGLVRLTWFSVDAAALNFVVERRTEANDWEPKGSIIPDGTGRLVYEDRAVIAGTRYGYRLSYPDGGALTYTAETWVQVPALQFGLRGLTPNPSAGDAMVAFSLLGVEPATLELFDLAGRMVLSREVGSLGAGPQSVRIDGRGQLRAGVYTVRLRQGGRAATMRAVVIR